MSERHDSDDLAESDYLSDCLRDYIADSIEEEGARSDASKAIDRLVSVATSSLEGFAPTDAQELLHFWQQKPLEWRWAVDEHYSREAVLAVPAIVQRFLRLSPVLVGRLPGNEATIYLREATRCFLYGFFQGSTALSRAALEAGINDLLRQTLGSVPTMDLVDKLRQLQRFGLLGDEDANDAHAVRKAGGSVLHESPAQDHLALDTIIKARRVLTRLYKA